MKRYLKFSVLFILLFSFRHIMFGQNYDPYKFIGIPFISDKDTSTKEGVKETLKTNFLKRLKELDGWNSRFDTLKKQKAFVIRYRSPSENPFVPFLYRHRYINFHISAWGGAWEYESLDTAKLRALEECKAVPYPYDDKYLDFIINDSINIPDSLINEYFDFKLQFQQEQVDSLKKAIKTNLISEAVVNLKENNKKKDTLPPIKLSVKKPIKIGYPDTQEDYASACQDRVFYALLSVENIDTIMLYRKQLTLLSDTGAYGIYYRSINTVLDYKDSIPNRFPNRKMEKMCSFANYYHFTSNPLSDSSIILPINFKSIFKNEEIEEIWVETSSKITEGGIPLVIEEYSKPLAIKTNKHFYIGIQIKMPDGGDRCYVSKPFKNKIISMSICVGDIKCAENVIKTLSESIENRLKKSPFTTQKINFTNLLDGELSMGRLYEPSLFLGNPFYEYTTYTFRTSLAYSDNPFYSLYNRQIYKGVNKENIKPLDGKELYTFLEFEYIFTRAIHKNGKYIDPDERELTRFEALLKLTVEEAIEEACNKLKGNMKGSICELINK